MLALSSLAWEMNTESNRLASGGHGVRQVAGTRPVMRPHSSQSIDRERGCLAASAARLALGVVEDTERTYVEVTTLAAIRCGPLTDGGTLGMILEVLA